MMSEAQMGDKVHVQYRATFARKEFSRKQPAKEIEFTVGEHQVIPGLENAVVGMKEGETKEITIPAKYAYGQRRSELVITLRKSQLPSDVSPAVGKTLDLKIPGGERKHVQVVSSSDHTVTLDANHPLAGKSLKFNLEVLRVKSQGGMA